MRKESYDLFKFIFNLCNKKKKTHVGYVKDESDKKLTNADEILNRRCDHNRRLESTRRVSVTVKGRSDQSLKETNKCKRKSSNNIGEPGIEIIMELDNKIYESANPDTIKKIRNNNHYKTCEKFRMISLMCQVMKIILKVILNRLKSKLNEEMSAYNLLLKKTKAHEMSSNNKIKIP